MNRHRLQLLAGLKSGNSMFVGLLLALSCFVMGCGDRVPIVEVSGVLTYQGQPVPNMLITFQPESGRPSWGQSDRAGKFTLNYSRSVPKGAIIGTHKVWLTGAPEMPSDDISPEEYAQQIASGESQAAVEIPNKYFSAGNTTIEITLTESTDDLIIDLP